MDPSIVKPLDPQSSPQPNSHPDGISEQPLTTVEAASSNPHTHRPQSSDIKKPDSFLLLQNSDHPSLQATVQPSHHQPTPAHHDITATPSKSRKRKIAPVPIQTPVNIINVSAVTRPGARKCQRLTALQKKKNVSKETFLGLRPPSGDTFSSSLSFHPGQASASTPIHNNTFVAATTTNVPKMSIIPSEDTPLITSSAGSPYMPTNTNSDDDAVLPYMAPAPSAAHILDLDLSAIFGDDSANGSESYSRVGGNNPHVRSSGAGQPHANSPISNGNSATELGDSRGLGNFVAPTSAKTVGTESQRNSKARKGQRKSTVDDDVNMDNLYPAVTLEQLETHSDLEAQNFVSNSLNRALGISTDQVDIHERHMEESELDLDFQASDLYDNSFQFENSIDSNGDPCNGSGRRIHHDRGDGSSEPQQIVLSGTLEDSDLEVDIQLPLTMESKDIGMELASQSASDSRPAEILQMGKGNGDAVDVEDVENDIRETIAESFGQSVRYGDDGKKQAENETVEYITGAVKGTSLTVEQHPVQDQNLFQLSKVTAPAPSNRDSTLERIISSGTPGQATGAGKYVKHEVDVQATSQGATEDVDAERAAFIADGYRMVNELMDFAEGIESNVNGQEVNGTEDNEGQVQENIVLCEELDVARLSSGETTRDITRLEVDVPPNDIFHSIAKESMFLQTGCPLRATDPIEEISLRDVYPHGELSDDLRGDYRPQVALEDTGTMALTPSLLPTASNSRVLTASEDILEELSAEVGSGGNENDFKIPRGMQHAGSGHRMENFAQADMQAAHSLLSQPSLSQAPPTTSKKPFLLNNGGITSVRTALNASKPGDAAAVEKAFATKKRHDLVAKRSLKRAARQAVRINSGVGVGVGTGNGVGDGSRFATTGPLSGKQVVSTPSMTAHSHKTARKLGADLTLETPVTAATTAKDPEVAFASQSGDVPEVVGLSYSDGGEPSVSGGRVAKGGCRRGGGARNPAHAHLSIEERRQLRAQRNRESAEKSRVRRKLATAELERSVALLRTESTSRGMRFQRTNLMLRDILCVMESSSAAAAAGDDEGQTTMLQKLHECVILLESIKSECPRTFRQTPKIAESERKFCKSEECKGGEIIGG